MRTHGWGGDPPADHDEAIRRILDAARCCVEEKGASTSTTDIADALGVTRQTVYRYFPSTEALLKATAIDAAGSFIERLAVHVDSITDPGAAAVEIVAYTLEHLPGEPYAGLLFASGRAGLFVHEITSSTAHDFGRLLLQRVSVDWEGAGIEGEVFDEFVEHILRTIQSLILAPGDPPRTGDALRRYLARWLWSPVLGRVGVDHGSA